MNDEERKELELLRALYKTCKSYQLYFQAHKLRELIVSMGELATWYRQQRVDLAKVQEEKPVASYCNHTEKHQITDDMNDFAVWLQDNNWEHSGWCAAYAPEWLKQKYYKEICLEQKIKIDFDYAQMESRFASFLSEPSVSGHLDTGRNPSPPPERMTLPPRPDRRQKVFNQLCGKLAQLGINSIVNLYGTELTTRNCNLAVATTNANEINIFFRSPHEQQVWSGGPDDLFNYGAIVNTVIRNERKCPN